MKPRVALRVLLPTVLLGLVMAAGWVADRAPSLGLPPLTETSAPAPSGARALGRKLFLDRRLSADGTTACATCHVPREAFAQTRRATPKGRTGTALRRNAPSLLNVGYAKVLHHDGSAPSLEVQIVAPLFNPEEMANASLGDLVSRVRGLADYQGLFEAAFGRPADIHGIGAALAAYERSLVSGNAPFDRWRYGGDARALSPLARQGYDVFMGKGRCAACHRVAATSALFTDHAFHNTGIGFLRMAGGSIPSDRGREEVTQSPADRFKYKTPSLRNVARTAPYMHDGSLPTLAEVVAHYDRGGTRDDPNLDPVLVPLQLMSEERAALVAFLESLDGDHALRFNAEEEAADAE